MKIKTIPAINLADSAATRNLKIGTGSGEKRLYIGNTPNEDVYDDFFGWSKEGDEVSITITKLSLIEYLIEAEGEFKHPSQKYANDITSLYDSLMNQTLAIKDDIITFIVIRNVDPKRYYIRPQGDYDYLRNIALPILTKFYFIKYVNIDENGDETSEIHLFPRLKKVVLPADIDGEDNNDDNTLPLQKIFYGAPGTGKSHEVKRITGEKDNENLPNVFRTIFHPDTDYATFVGCYKPTMKPVEEKYRAVAGKEEDIAYEFVPQAFTDAYVYAYNNPNENTYLVIEEINRGNCAQIFGDLFQLLDRNSEGKSEYTIKADKDLAKYLVEKLGEDSEGIADGKLCLPANFNILATMNTSDQSLFPMDSAFKRRWDWEYVAINYNEPKSKGFEIILSEEKYNWCEFIKQVNKRIFALTQSEDKELGNFFIKNSINAEQFKSKVMFYLWYEVLRDEVENSKYFFYYIQQDEDTGKESTKKFTYKELYGDKAETILDGFLRYIAKGAVE